jgi:hypothetical protein
MIHVAAILAAASVPLAGNTTTFVGKDATRLLAQCSRSAPDAGERFFRPDAAAIESLERAVAARDPAVGGIGGLRRGWVLEATGIVRNGRRHVYGSFTPSRFHVPSATQGTPTVICDGGPTIFGAEIDLATGRITHWAANGRL